LTSVRVEPAGVDIVVDAGETLMAAAVRAGYRWPTVCGGQAECGVCVLSVVSSGFELAPPSPLEAGRLATVPERVLSSDAVLRLACQLRVDGDGLVVFKRGVRRT
jgi:ferredoxin, 2Fe-2S